IYASRWALPGPVNAWFYGLLLGTVILLLWVLMGSRSYMQKIRKQISLGERIDQYARLVFYRLGAGAMVGMVAPLFFYMSNDLRFATFMLIFLLWTARFWPGRRRLCDELKLTSSEQEVIMKR
ncbi:MAG: hypothetical protein K1X47_14805, partial [Cyclobacteriaceae bacterium]|nr:hypothetical protein [Cyclobacteriaceae bacterium]